MIRKRVCAGFASMMMAIAMCAQGVSADADIKRACESIDMPLLCISTIDGEMPTCQVVTAPAGCIGTSITDNNYVAGRMVMTLSGDTLYDSGEYEQSVSGMRIKIRGNSTGAYLDQHPYKIKLSKKSDLLRRGDEYKHKEWLLLSMYTWNVKMTREYSNLLNIAGTVAAKAVGVEWTPSYEFVNVMLNGKYQGMYYLMESVSRDECRVNVSNEGFIIEHDPFFWNEDGHFFKTNHQIAAYGYTYKYPDKDEVTDDVQTAICDYMNEFEDCLYGDGDVAQYIDMESFAKWILVHDILGTDDGAGCNKFLYKYDMLTDAASSKLKIGPPWDYDSCFRIGDGQWSKVHTMTAFYYPKLFERNDFKEEYLRQWDRVSSDLESVLLDGLEEEYEKYHAAFDEGIALHNKFFPGEGVKTCREQIDELKKLMSQRVGMMENLTADLVATDVELPSGDARVERMLSIDGLEVTKTTMTRGIYIIVYTDGSVRKIIKK
ncbi:MAG: CotH kinase family protein [Prevotella sp.]|nr:CotH kinase family protein [Prevotella sp.]